MRKTRMSTKLGFVVAIMVLATVVVAVIGTTQLGSVNQKVEYIVSFSNAESRLASDLRMTIMSMLRAEKNAVLAPTDELSRKFADQAVQLASEGDKIYQNLKDLYARDTVAGSEDKQNLDSFGPAWEAFKKGDRELGALSVQNTNIKATTLSLGKGLELSTKLEQANVKLAALCDSGIEQAKAASDTAKAANLADVRRIGRDVLISMLRVHRMHAMHINSSDEKEMTAMDNQIKAESAATAACLEALRAKAEGDALPVVAAMKEASVEFDKVTAEVQRLSHLNTNNRSAEMSLTTQRELSAAVDAVAAKQIGILNKANDRDASEAAAIYARARTLIIVVGLACIIGAMTMAILVVTGLTRSISRISDTLAAGAEQTSSAAGQVSASSQSLAQGASEQAASLEETSSSLEEMSSMTKKNAESAQQAAGLSAETKHAADQGNQAMDKMSAAINEIQKSAAATAKIIKVIDEIAFQTNLLALNAAVEAARAGEAGKGFAVVAEEVRNLAMRSAEAAKNTASMIEESVQNAKNGVAITSEVAKSLQEITGAATKVNALVTEISAASQEQTTGIDQVNKAVSQMDKVTQSNAASAEESASASEELSSQAEQMKSMVGELIALVNGAAAGATTGPVVRQAGTRTATAARASKTKGADAIPFDSEPAAAAKGDFRAFNKAA